MWVEGRECKHPDGATERATEGLEKDWGGWKEIRPPQGNCYTEGQAGHQAYIPLRD